MTSLRIAVAQLDCSEQDDELRRRLDAIVRACASWRVDLVAVPRHHSVAELLASLTIPSGLAVIADAQPAPGLPAHAVLDVDEFVFRTLDVDRARVIAARREAGFVLLRGSVTVLDRRHCERFGRPVLLVNDAELGGTGCGCWDRRVQERLGAIEVGSEGVVIVDVEPRGSIEQVRPVARTGLVDEGDRAQAEYARWVTRTLARLEGDEEVDAIRRSIDEASELLTRLEPLGQGRAQRLRQLLIRLYELDRPQLLAHLREIVVPAADASAQIVARTEPGPRAPLDAPVDAWPESEASRSWSQSRNAAPELRLRVGVEHPTALAWSPDGELLAIGEREGIRVWRRADRRLVAGFAPYPWARSLAWSPDGEELAVVDRNGRTVSIWPVRSLARRLREVGGVERHAAFEEVTWSPCGRYLALGGSRVAVRSVAGGRTLWEHARRVVALEWSRDGASIFGVEGWEPVRFRADDGRSVPADRAVTGVSRWIDDGRALVVSDLGGPLELCSSRGSVSLERVELGQTRSIAAAPSATLIAAGQDHQVCVWGRDSGACLERYEGTVTSSKRIAWSADDALALLDDRGNLRITRPQQGGLEVFEARPFTHAMRASPDGSYFAFTRPDRVWIWTRGWEPFAILEPEHEPLELAWAHDGRRLAVATRRGTVEIHDPRGDRIARLSASNDSVQQLAWSRDGERVLAIDRAARLWRWTTTTGRPLAEPDRVCDPPGRALSPDAELLLVWDYNNTTALLELEPGARTTLSNPPDPPSRERVPTEVQWSPDARWVARAFYNQLQLWCVDDGRTMLRRLRGSIRQLAWSRDSSRVAATDERGVRVLAIDHPMANVDIEARETTCVAWSADGHSLIAADNDGVIRIHDSHDGSLRGRVVTRGSTALLTTADGKFAIHGDPSEVGEVRRRGEVHVFAPLGDLVDQQDPEAVAATLAGQRQAPRRRW